MAEEIANGGGGDVAAVGGAQTQPAPVAGGRGEAGGEGGDDGGDEEDNELVVC